MARLLIASEVNHLTALRRFASNRACYDNGNLVIWAETALACGGLTSKIGLMELHSAVKLMGSISRNHHQIDILMRQPSC